MADIKSHSGIKPREMDSKMSSKNKSHEHLYNVSLEALDLSETATNLLMRTGITSVGDCIDFFIRLQNALVPAKPPFFSLLQNEVIPRLKELGYWQYVDLNNK
ncbi:MAG: hypothetical protein OHK0046_48310 [Anaerolineae bacterium]